MRTSVVLLGITVAIAATAGGCASDPKGRAGGAPITDATVEVPRETRLLPAPSAAPKDLPGVDVGELSSRERELYWRWVSQLYAPCPEIAVSVADCVSDQRPCASCGAAARFLADRARSGDATNDAMSAFNIRFGPDVKKVDLADSPAKGRADAPITIVVWSDYECPACGYAVPKLEEAIAKRDDVRLVHKLYPLRSHTHSRAAARAALAALKQGKYWEMERLLFANQKKLEDADLEGYARDLGLDMKRFGRDFADQKADEIIDRDRAEADKHGLSGTPFILINGRELDLGLFRVDRDLVPWLDAEIAIQKRAAELRAIAAVGGALTGEGRGPVGPLSTGVPGPPPAPSGSAPASPKP